MQRSMFALPLVGILVVGAIAGAALTKDSTSEALGAAGKCSNASLVGSYAVEFTGHSSALGRFASVSLWRFDGKGKMKASETFNSESTGPQTRQISGKYAVKRDCRFTLAFGSTLVQPHEADGVCVLMAKGREFICVDNETGWITTGTGTRM